MSSSLYRRCAALLLVLFCSSLLQANPTDYGLLVEEFWYELEPLVKFDDEYPIEEETAVQRLLELARYVFSGMIYGFTFSYTPADAARKISEEFNLEPVALISWGDPNLEVMDTRVEERRLYARISYTPREFQQAWLAGWDSNEIPAAAGEGRSSFIRDRLDKVPVIEEAVKQAVRDYVRKRVFDKPKEITGSVILRNAPIIYSMSGEYMARVGIKLKIDEIQPYRLF
jgi:hypothetical protein